jgi:hypothetical protein
MTGIQEAKTWDVSRQALEEITTRIKKVSTERRAAFEDLCQIQARIDAHREILVAKGGPPVDHMYISLQQEWSDAMNVYREKLQQLVTLSRELNSRTPHRGTAVVGNSTRAIGA